MTLNGPYTSVAEKDMRVSESSTKIGMKIDSLHTMSGKIVGQ